MNITHIWTNFMREILVYLISMTCVICFWFFPLEETLEKIQELQYTFSTNILLYNFMFSRIFSAALANGPSHVFEIFNKIHSTV